MITARGFTSGVLLGWVSTFASIAIGLFMSPFLIHHLGVAGYGVWILIQSTVSYMYFMDLGLRTTVVRFSATAQAQGDHVGVSKVISAALWIRLWTASGIMAIAITLATFLPHLFKIPPALLSTGRIALLLVAATLCSTLVFSVFNALLSGLGRFDLLGLMELIQIAVTTTCLVTVIELGRGLVAMAICQLAVVLAVNLLNVTVCFRIYPHLHLFFHAPEKELLHSLWSLGLFVLIANGAGQLILYTDNVVVGAFVAAAAVSYYAVAAKMVEYVRTVAISILKYFMPLASSFAARQQMDRVRQLHLRGTQAVLLVTYPLVLCLMLRGGTLLRLWIGNHFSAEATGVLTILSVAAALMLANSGVNSLALALDRQRLLAYATLIEGLFNLGLSIFLVRRIGVLGVAWGTLIPTLLIPFLFWPPYLCRLLNMSLPRYLLEGWLRPIAAMIPFALACYWAERHWIPTKLIWFLLQMAALLPFAILGAVLLFWKDVPAAWRLISKRSPQPSVSAAAEISA